MEPLDLEQQAEEIGIDRETLLSLYYVFIKQTEKDLVTLKHLIVDKNDSDLRDIAHHIKGASLNLEINSMAECASIIVDECDNAKSWSLMEVTSRSLDRQFQELKLRISMEEKSGS